MTISAKSTRISDYGAAWIHGTDRWLKLLLLATVVIHLVYAGTGCNRGPLDSSTKHFLTAQEALERGDQQAALAALDAAIAAKPHTYAYLERAKLKVAMGDEAGAIADCEEGLAADPEAVDLRWFLDQLKKPQSSRFQGGDATPPSHNK